MAKAHSPQLEYIIEHRELLQAPDVHVPALAQMLYSKYLNPRSAGSHLLACTSQRLRSQAEKLVKEIAPSADPEKLAGATSKARECLSVVAKVAIKSIEADCMPAFLQSPQCALPMAPALPPPQSTPTT